MSALNLRNVLRRNPDRPSLRDRAAALKVAARLVIRPPKLEAGAAAPGEAAAIVDRVLISLVQEFVAIGKAQDETLAANDHPTPSTARIGCVSNSAAPRSWRGSFRPGLAPSRGCGPRRRFSTSAGSRALLSRSMTCPGRCSRTRTRSRGAPAGRLTDPHVRHAARPAAGVRLDPRGAPARGVCPILSRGPRLYRRPAPLRERGERYRSPATACHARRLGALALALSVNAEEAIGRPQNDGMDDQRYPEERRLVAAIRAMMAASGVEPLPGWVGFEVGPDSDADGRP